MVVGFGPGIDPHAEPHVEMPGLARGCRVGPYRDDLGEVWGRFVLHHRVFRAWTDPAEEASANRTTIKSVQTIADVVAAIDEIAPSSKAAGWDPVGLQLGDPAAAATRVGVCHEATSAVVEAAAEHRLDLLVTYHPLLFRATNRLIAGPSASGRAFSLIRSGTALGVVHTAFDVAPGGTADALAGSLALQETAGFGPMWGTDAVKFVVFVPVEAVDTVANAMAAAGAGEIGNYSGCSFRTSGMGSFVAEPGASPSVGQRGSLTTVEEVRLEMVAPLGRRDAVAGALVAAHPYEEPAFDVFDQRGNAGMVGRVGALSAPMGLEEFAAGVQAALGATARVAGERSGTIARVAVVPGSGGDFVAAAAGVADVLVTGDVSHHRAAEALERGLAVIDAGHAATERPGMAALYAALGRVVDDLVDLTGIETDPWKDGR